jgi:class 3 adenylate cyclase/pimeloyl-ACP methyl ester carboxylesterase
MTSTDLPETRFAQSGDVNIAYQVMGDGPVNLIIVPGIISNVEVAHEMTGYTQYLRRLAKFACVVTFDKRGQGLSDRVAGAPSLEERSDDVRAVMDDLDMRQAAIFGVSEGTMMSVFFAASHPERVTHLITFGGGARYASADDYPFAPSASMLRAALTNSDPSAVLRYFAPSIADDPDEVVRFAKHARLSCSPGNYRALIEMNLDLDVRGVLGQICVPTLVLHRKADLVRNIENARYLAVHIPGAKLIEYPEADHIPWLGDTDTLCADIEEFVTGQRNEAPVAIDRVLATVLFTDIVDSTAHAAAMGDAGWRKTLDEHDRIAKRLVEQHRGRVIKMTGDGVLAMFDGPGRAIRCALGMEPALARLQLSVRAGLHTGEVEERGVDIGGIAVHTASRVMSNAGAGEVLVSRVVADLVAGSGIVFADRGEVALKGMSGTFRLLAASV